ncbi:ABC-type transport system, involved in lipoprotein release, permease component [Ruminococcus flavefaciens]|uniref:ABC-type transport system, involved in lipoprotein release, permease component n=1 Tax=Ruminococcus flavefaciens TaxID=1265 RepID=A0A1H6KBH5_RUMFL|nr:ABC transporter permease [Ruminococcus flavefaciens]SEH69139.1 ABC-type transport system, involved in lipoprotein release, permease component [Ruminococcus flavefaciens]
MRKIVRLSWANIKKHKLETGALVILVMLCMLLISSSLEGISSIKSIFPNMMKNTESYENYILIPDNAYNREYENILSADERVEKSAASELLYSMSTNYLDDKGKEQALYMAFITKDNENKLERAEIETTMSDAEIADIKHPIYMPFSVKDGMGYKVGDKFDMIFGTKKFSFTVTGFYDTVLFDTSSGGLKMIVSDEDYHVLEAVLTKYNILVYNDNQGKGGTDLGNELIEAFEDYSNLDVKSGYMMLNYKNIKDGVVFFTELMLKVMIAMAAVIIVAIIIMIRYRIAGDIKDQIVSIGVLEAIGYTSKNITFSYVIEYLIISAVGILLGIGGCLMLSPVLFRTSEIMSGHRIYSKITLSPILLTAGGIILFVSLIAFIRANMVKKYPPVCAFRKGLGDHRFGKERLPLRDTKKSVHLRLAMKGFLNNFKQNIGLTACITISAIAIVFSFVMFSFFNDGMDAIVKSAGMEMSNLRVELMNSADAYEFAAEVEQMPEVRKATPTSGLSQMIKLVDCNELMFPMAFRDFKDTENIFPIEGRFPEHDNELMITNMCSRSENINVGDSVTLDYLNVKRKYIVTGIVTCLTNGGINIYLTEDGMKRLIPTYTPNTVEVYLKDGVNAEDFRYRLTQEYGRSISDMSDDESTGSSYEDRIKAEADRQIADLMASYGVSHIEYAIQAGDTVIKGNSSGFMIKSVMNILDIMNTQLSGIAQAISVTTTLFMLISALVVMIILFILMESSVRRQRKELGIMKGMGYTSKELMFQLAFRIMPAALFSVIIGTLIGIAAVNLITGYIGYIAINIPAVIVLDILLLLFCFGCAYIGARKIKKISVYELMTE